jgi:hypothetical protein
MRISPRDLAISDLIKKRFVWGIFERVFCDSCNYLVRLEHMWVVSRAPGTKFFCTECYSSAHDLADDIFVEKVTPMDILVRNERRAAREEILKMFEELHKLPDGEISPSVEKVLLMFSPDITDHKNIGNEK